MNTQPEALWLADALDNDPEMDWLMEAGIPKAAAELRRLHEENQALRHALSQPEQRGMKKLEVTLVDRPIDIELAQYKRMFEAACSALGAIGDALGVDPEEGGADPILAAIAEIKSAQPEQKSAVYQCPRCATSMDVDLNAKPVDTVNTSQERVDEIEKRRHEVVAQDLEAPLTINGVALYPKREWVGLTKDEIEQTCSQTFSFDPFVIAKAIEAKLKEKNT